MYFLPSMLPIFLLALSIVDKSLATPIIPSNYGLPHNTARSVIQPRTDWDEIAAEIRADTELIDALNEIGTDCEDDMVLLGVETVKQPMAEKGYTRQAPVVFYTSGMGEAAMDWAPRYFKEKDPENWEDAPQDEWKYVIWLRAAHQFPRAMHKRMQKLPTAVGKVLEGYEFQRPIKSWTSDIGQKNEVQALAEIAEGDVYLAVPAHENPSNDVNGWDTTLAWGGMLMMLLPFRVIPFSILRERKTLPRNQRHVHRLTFCQFEGWEFPALAQNDKINTLYRIDPTKEDTPVKIWQKGDPRPKQEPKGNREDIIFHGDFGDFFKDKTGTVLPIQRKLKTLMSK
ncbi:uncharacterized protein N7459_000188 [Penicillium hispanicum]|uniref:uncharacterized protein n=1 Tax=Penicillium hispanicum TaxID=1080232 RepID=UPI0025419276|nr:uncharacterized protein N7459_000188 [Penicillium hispanicum]KAJ5593980.1 hypothetical protein N7459_000188 [Penicillium hispanicum]